MEPIKFTLCEECEHCPEVEITGQCVRIGENENTVRCRTPSGTSLFDLLTRNCPFEKRGTRRRNNATRSFLRQ